MIPLPRPSGQGRSHFEDRASGSRDDFTGLVKALAFIRLGGCLVV